MVNVLISVYNGERFIEKQIESILEQSYDDFHIYIRDDGSSDSSMRKVEKYLSTGKVTVFKGENIGFAQSFLELLKMADKGEYWAFCDQDDVWHSDKLLWAVEWLDKQNPSTPCLFHSAFENVDIDLRHLSFYNPPQYEYTFQRALTECMYLGFSMVINVSLRELMLQATPEKIVSHDWWAQLIAAAFGVCKFDARIASKHRRHTDSVTLDNGKKKLEWLKKSLVNGNRIANNADEFERIFASRLSLQNRKLLEMFTHKTLKGNLTRAFYPKRWRPSLPSELAMRWLMLTGKS